MTTNVLIPCTHDSARSALAEGTPNHLAAAQCPYWPGIPVEVHWGCPDPSNAPAPDRTTAFEPMPQAVGYRMLQRLRPPLASMTDADLQAAQADIARN